MSIRIMTAVFDRYPNGGGEMLLALALADHAHDDGTHIYPSVKQLAEKTRQSERTVQYQLRRMEECGWLLLTNEGHGGRNQHREYRISPEWIKGAEIAPFKKGANDSIKGAIHDRKGATDDRKGAIHDIKGCNPLHPHITVIESSITVIESSADPKAQGVPPIAEESIDPVIFEFPLNDGTIYGLRQSQIDQFAKLYPGIDLDKHLRACLGWNMANPTRRKTRGGILNHINSWLADKQNKAPATHPSRPVYQARNDRSAAAAAVFGPDDSEEMEFIDVN